MASVESEVESKRIATFDFRLCSVLISPKKFDQLTGGASSSKTILHRVSGSVTSSTILGIMGPSGAGKTTLLNLLSATPASSGEIRSGEIRLNGHNFSSDSERPADVGTRRPSPCADQQHIVGVVRSHRQSIHHIARSSSRTRLPGRGSRVARVCTLPLACSVTAFVAQS